MGPVVYCGAMAEIPDSEARASCDLDGVLTLGQGKTPYDFAPMRPGAQAFLRELHERYQEVIIHTARPTDAAKNWLRENGLLKYAAAVTNTKLPSKVYIDDRAVEFQGDFKATLRSIKDFLPHWQDNRSNVGAYEYASTQFDLPPAMAETIIAMGRNVPENLLADNGREEKPHVTILYGIEDESPDKLTKALRGFGRVRIRLGSTGFFSIKDKGFDVVKVEVISEDIKRLRKAVEKASTHHTDFPDYKPHATIAYTVLGSGKRFADDRTLSGESVEFDTLVFSGKTDERTHIPLV